jgi:hypothetical protein
MRLIDIAMIPMTDEPMEGIAFDVQDHARRTGTILDWYTWGDDQFRPPWAKYPIRWMLRPC